MPQPVTSPAWMDPSGNRGEPQGPQFVYINESGVYVKSNFTGERDPVTGRWMHDRAAILLGTLVVPNWFGTTHGPYKFGDETCMVPMHISPPLFAPGEGYKFVVRIPILVQVIEQIIPWYCTGNTAQREMGLLREAFQYCAEAATGKLRVYALRTSRQFTANVKDPTTNAMIAKRLTAPVWEPIDCMDYDPAIFGERIVPPPSPQVINLTVTLCPHRC